MLASKKIDGELVRRQRIQVEETTRQLISASEKQNKYLRQLKEKLGTITEEEQRAIQENLAQSTKKRIKYGEQLIAFLGMMQQKTRNYQIPYLIYLIATKLFSKVASVIVNIRKEQNVMEKQFDDDEIQKKQKFISQIEGLFLNFMNFANKVCPKLFDTFCKQQIKSLLEVIILPQKIQEKEEVIDSQFQKIVHLLKQIFEQYKQSSSINYTYEQILKYESNRKSDDLFREISINWIKYKLDEAREVKDYICCKNIFFFNQKFDCFKRKLYSFHLFKYSNVQQYMNSQKQKEKVLQKRKITEDQLQLARTITALMNQKGGVIFLGIVMQNQKKNCTVVGFQLDDKQKKQLLMYIKRLVNQVLPKHKGFEQLDEASTHVYSGSVYALNYYTTVEFINVVQKQTFENHREKGNKKVCICKIVVKIGHPRYIYYVLINDGNKQDRKQAQIQFYIRNEDGNQKETLQKCYDGIYKKLIDYQTIKHNPLKAQQRLQIHDGCRYDMSLKKQNLILDIKDSSDEDD